MGKKKKRTQQQQRQKHQEPPPADLQQSLVDHEHDDDSSSSSCNSSLAAGMYNTIQWSPDLTNLKGPNQLFVKPGYSLYPIFLWSKKTFCGQRVTKTDSLNLDDLLKLSSLNPASTVLYFLIYRVFLFKWVNVSIYVTVMGTG